LLARIAELEDRVAKLASGAPPEPSSEPISLPDPPKAEEKPAEAPKEEPAAPGGGMQEVDVTEAAEKLPDSFRSYFDDCECLVSPDRKQVLIRTANEMGRMILSMPQNLASIRSALYACGLTDVGAAVEIVPGAKPRAKKAPVDELADF
ncbi:MAG: hypothetical protein II836_01410, partial [Clostridia bacterium]|nr:hypothetical protein [Clostridia bacterium]